MMSRPASPRVRSRSRGPPSRPRQKRLFPEHFPKEQAESLVASGVLFRGKLRVLPAPSSVAFVSSDRGDLPRDIVIRDETARNRALNGDIVAVKLLPVDEWKQNREADPNASSDSAMATALESSDSSAAEEELWWPSSCYTSFAQPENGPQASLLCEWGELAQRYSLQPAGEVVCVLQPDHKMLLTGTLRLPDSPGPVGTITLFRPADRRFPPICVPSAGCLEPYSAAGRLFLVKLDDDWPSSSRLPRGNLVRCVGNAGEIPAETEALLIESSIAGDGFPAAVFAPLERFQHLAAAAAKSGAAARAAAPQPRALVRRRQPVAAPLPLPAEEMAGRADLRALTAFTIDPPGAKDLDDALHVAALGDGVFEIGVHIADVTHFVPAGSALDAEAQRRGTTVYLVQKTVPMLPPLLSEQLCSLLPRVDRLVWSVVFHMRADGSFVDAPVFYARTVIQSKARLDYETAQRMIDGLVDPAIPQMMTEDVWESARRPTDAADLSRVVKSVRILHQVASRRREKRFAGGCVSLDSTKLSFDLREEDGLPTDCRPCECLAAHHVVEEFMLIANYLVAKKLLECLGGEALLRRHPEPVAEGLQSLRETLADRGVTLDVSSPRALQASLTELHRNGDAVLAQAVTALATSPMRLAQYVAAGAEQDPRQWRHFGLSAPFYTHFTSPIRRYADCVVHRLLAKALATNKNSSSREEAAGRKQQLWLARGGGAGGGASSSGGWEPEEGDAKRIARLAAVAKHLDERTAAAKAAEERSGQVYLAAYLAGHPLTTEAVVVSFGSSAFTVYIPRLNHTARIDAASHGLSGNVVVAWDPGCKKLTLCCQSDASAAESWGQWEVAKLAKCLVRCFGGADVVVHFARPLF